MANGTAAHRLQSRNPGGNTPSNVVKLPRTRRARKRVRTIETEMLAREQAFKILSKECGRDEQLDRLKAELEQASTELLESYERVRRVSDALRRGELQVLDGEIVRLGLQSAARSLAVASPTIAALGTELSAVLRVGSF